LPSEPVIGEDTAMSVAGDLARNLCAASAADVNKTRTTKTNCCDCRKLLAPLWPLAVALFSFNGRPPS
jgi:hypothetical protein